MANHEDGLAGRTRNEFLFVTMILYLLPEDNSRAREEAIWHTQYHEDGFLGRTGNVELYFEKTL